MYFSAIMTGSYNNFFRIFDLNKKDVTLEASKNWIKPKAPLKPKKVNNRLYIWYVKGSTL